MAAAIKSIMKMPSLPPQLPATELDNLPEGPGVYTFYGVNDLPIYIGKAKNIRARVRSHFSSDHRSANDQRLSVEITRMDFEETAGELGALLREATLIKTRLPLRNHQLRRNRALTMVRLLDLASPPEFLAMDEVDFAQGEALYGPFATKSRAKSVLLALAADHGLCWNILSTKKTSGPCFAHQIYRCRGYCVGKESLSQHNLRLKTAMVAHQFRTWPSEGAIAIKESHPDGKLEQIHLFHHWQYLGTANDEQALDTLLTTKLELDFDADIYKLLVKYFNSGGFYQSVNALRG